MELFRLLPVQHLGETVDCWLNATIPQNHEIAKVLTRKLRVACGQKENIAKASAIYQKLAEAGDEDAQFALYELYAIGTEIPRNRAKGLYWLRQAAQNNNFYLSNLAEELTREGASSQEIAEGLEIYQQLAEEGSVNSQLKLYEIYAQGKLAPKATEKSIYWFNRAYRNPNADDEIHYFFIRFGIFKRHRCKTGLSRSSKNLSRNQ